LASVETFEREGHAHLRIHRVASVQNSGSSKKTCSAPGAWSREQEVGLGRNMKATAEHIAQALAFERFANAAADPLLKQAYADIAGCYRILAREYERHSHMLDRAAPPSS
jgi:hypothetical protein